jgi:hypothetical protein
MEVQKTGKIFLSELFEGAGENILSILGFEHLDGMPAEERNAVPLRNLLNLPNLPNHTASGCEFNP